MEALARKHEKSAKDNADAARRLAEIEESRKREQKRLTEARRASDERAEISEAQRREILKMDWLIDDIERNGTAETVEQAEVRPVPEFEVAADHDCPSG